MVHRRDHLLESAFSEIKAKQKNHLYESSGEIEPETSSIFILTCRWLARRLLTPNLVDQPWKSKLIIYCYYPWPVGGRGSAKRIRGRHAPPI